MSIHNYITSLSAYRLANMADCGTPDTAESPGAMMLLNVASDFAEILTVALDDNPDLDITEWVVDVAHEIADGAPDVYTHTRWEEFVDLAAFREDPSELRYSAEIDMTELAGICLYIIAERLVWALAEMAVEYLDNLRVHAAVHSDGVVEVFDADEYSAPFFAAIRQNPDDSTLHRPDVADCGTCGRMWDDAVASSRTPTPAGRCPFEYDHE